MKPESASLRAVVFIDGQNLFRSAKEAFGHTYPNYDPMSLVALGAFIACIQYDVARFNRTRRRSAMTNFLLRYFSKTA
jgi:hypothetical protein